VTRNVCRLRLPVVIAGILHQRFFINKRRWKKYKKNVKNAFLLKNENK